MFDVFNFIQWISKFVKPLCASVSDSCFLLSGITIIVHEVASNIISWFNKNVLIVFIDCSFILSRWLDLIMIFFFLVSFVPLFLIFVKRWLCWQLSVITLQFSCAIFSFARVHALCRWIICGNEGEWLIVMNYEMENANWLKEVKLMSLFFVILPRICERLFISLLFLFKLFGNTKLIKTIKKNNRCYWYFTLHKNYFGLLLLWFLLILQRLLTK